jgi:hypothetical protein
VVCHHDLQITMKQDEEQGCFGLRTSLEEGCRLFITVAYCVLCFVCCGFQIDDYSFCNQSSLGDVAG